MLLLLYQLQLCHLLTQTKMAAVDGICLLPVCVQDGGARCSRCFMLEPGLTCWWSFNRIISWKQRFHTTSYTTELVRRGRTGWIREGVKVRGWGGWGGPALFVAPTEPSPITGQRRLIQARQLQSCSFACLMSTPLNGKRTLGCCRGLAPPPPAWTPTRCTQTFRPGLIVSPPNCKTATKIKIGVLGSWWSWFEPWLLRTPFQSVLEQDVEHQNNSWCLHQQCVCVFTKQYKSIYHPLASSPQVQLHSFHPSAHYI